MSTSSSHIWSSAETDDSLIKSFLEHSSPLLWNLQFCQHTISIIKTKLMDLQILADLFLTQLRFSNIDARVDIFYPNPPCLVWLVKYLSRFSTFHLHRCCWRRSRTLLLSFLPSDQPGWELQLVTSHKQISPIRVCRLKYMTGLWKWLVIFDVKDRDVIGVDMGWLDKLYTADPPPWLSGCTCLKVGKHWESSSLGHSVTSCNISMSMSHRKSRNRSLLKMREITLHPH